MALKKVRLFDMVGESGELIETITNNGKALGMLHKKKAAAMVIYEVLETEQGGTSGHKHVLNIYTREDLLEDIERGEISFEMR